MRTIPFPGGHCNLSPVRHWPFSRLTASRPYPLTYPSHPRLVERLCPMQTKLTSRDHDGLTWAQVKGWL